MNNKTLRPIGLSILVLMMLIVSIGITSSYISTHFVSLEEHQAMVDSKDEEIKKLSTAFITMEEGYKKSAKDLVVANTKLRSENKLLTEDLEKLKQIARYSNSGVKFSRGSTLSIFEKVNYNEITKSSNLSLKEIRYLLQGSPMYEAASKIYYWDKQGVNAFFTIAIARTETNVGRTSNKNNAFGTKKGNDFKRFGSFSESVNYFAERMKGGYFAKGSITPEVIQPIYCPPNSEWDNHVRGYMYEYYSKIKEENTRQIVATARY